VKQVADDKPAALVTSARIRIDGTSVYAPAQQLYKARGDIIATPSVKTGLAGDIYLTLLTPATDASSTVTFGVRLMPFSMWLWVGGGLMAVGTLLAAFPGRRRRPTDPVSAPVRVTRTTDRVTEEPELVGVPRLGGADA
jgi:cytochrome c-type biogenesis protein CcmF